MTERESTTEGPIADLRRRLEAQPRDARLHFQLGELLMARGDGDAAIESFCRAVEFAPRVAAAHFGLANAYYSGGRYEEAIATFRASYALEADAPTANNIGNALARSGKLEEAAAMFAEALRLDSSFLPAMANLGQACLTRGDSTGAASWFEQVVERRPEQASALILLGDAYRSLGRIEAAATQYVRAAVLRPDDAALFHRLGDINRTRGRLTESQFCYAKVLELDPRSAPSHSALLDALLHDPGATAENIAHETRYWAQCHVKGIEPLSLTVTLSAPDRRLRIGYVSSDLCGHSIGYLLEPVLKHHDRNNFEIICYALGAEVDDQTRRLQSAADVWRQAADLPPDQLAALIRDDAIDLLVDLSGHAAGNRLPAFAAKPAPVQVAWLGYPGTTGLAAIDYVLADRRSITPEEEGLFVERVYRLETGPICFAQPTTDIAVSPLPARSSGVITFGAFHDLAKINPSVIALWSVLLQSDPSFRLFIKTSALGDPAVQDSLAAQFAENFVDRTRLRLEGVATREELLTAYHDVDIALDPFPYGEALTTLEALWMGVPIVHLRGRRFAGRAGDGILQDVDLPEFIVETREDYISKARESTADLDRLAELRSRLRTQLQASSLCDAPSFVRALEAAYRMMWREACAK